MGYNIDPSKAIADFDSISLVNYNITETSELLNDKQTIKTVIFLEGGLGRVYTKEYGHRFIDDSIRVTAKADFYLNDKQLEEMKDLLSKWKSISPPLRYVDFGDKAIILEDSDTFMILPKGKRNIEFDMPNVQ
jgi:hypothetical protein